MKSILQSVVLLFAVTFCADVLVADVFLLATGGRIVGDLANPNESPRRTYVIQVGPNSYVTLDRIQVRGVLSPSPAEKKYEEILVSMPPTAEGNWIMSEWCREQNLPQHRLSHLRMAVELDPNHEDARRQLGYIERDGQWTTRDQWQAAQGFVKVGRTWMPAQLADVRKRQEANDQRRRDTLKRVNQLSSWLGTKRNLAAIQGFKELRDPLAALPLGELLEKDQSMTNRRLYVDALGRMKGSITALDLLLRTALEDPKAEIRDRCIDLLVRIESKRAVSRMIKQLGDKRNQRINRAAAALGRLGDPRAIAPLIEVLVTQHKVVVQKQSAGSISPSFSSGPGGIGGAGLSAGAKTTTKTYVVQNREVLAALVNLTGGTNHLYDQENWRAWYAREQMPQEVTLRRTD